MASEGTAKSTAVRGLAAVLPEIEVATCTYGCAPRSLNVCEDCREQRNQNLDIESTTRQVRVVDLPVSATEDRVIGTLDLEAALSRGERKFEPGLLAAAHRGSAVCGRSQSAGRPPGGHAAGQRGLGHESDRTRRAFSTGIRPNTSWLAR